MDLSIIIVSWNVKDRLKENLRALFDSKHVSFEVIVVDNNSADRTAEMVKKEYPNIKLIANAANLGFARANNQGIKLAQGKYVLLLNPDMRVFDDTLSNMISWMNCHEQAAVAGCKLIGEDGVIIRHVRRFPKFLDQLAIILKLPHFLPKVTNHYLINDFDYKKSAKVDSIRGGFFLIRAQTIKQIGLLDEQYFLWFEEVDYCQRVSRAGLEVWYSSAAECIDLVGQSFRQVNLSLKQKYFRDSMLKYFKKWHAPIEYWLLKSAWPLGRLLAWAGEKLKLKSRART
ncbi:MAG: glycosyltransferase family 2 protein [Patescibacteria group bacterium]|nr:glycosyltransferase family 2 protein [Patescibacteria group bacterium]